MKSMKLALVAALTAMATPALAVATAPVAEAEKSNPAVWIALGASFIAIMTSMFAIFVASKGKKKPTDD